MFVGNKVYKIKILVTQSFKYNFLPVLVSLLTLTTVVKIKEAKACAWDGIEDFAVLLNYKCQLFHMCLTQHYCDKICKSSICILWEDKYIWFFLSNLREGQTHLWWWHCVTSDHLSSPVTPAPVGDGRGVSPHPAADVDTPAYSGVNTLAHNNNIRGVWNRMVLSSRKFSV